MEPYVDMDRSSVKVSMCHTIILERLCYLYIFCGVLITLLLFSGVKYLPAEFYKQLRLLLLAFTRSLRV
jgi:hypothetical protein